MANQRNNSSLDGFVPRRPGAESASQLGEQSGDRFSTPRPMSSASHPSMKTVGMTPIAKSELDDSLKGIDQPLAGKGRRKRGDKKQKSRLRRIIKWVVIVIIVAALAAGGYLAYKALNASNQIFKGSILDIVQNQPLKEDANGRSNILIFGTSEDDPGHSGANLTDSIMVISLSQKQKNAYMISIPRDLYVEYGASCAEGYRGRINSLYDCFSENDTKEAEGAGKLQEKVGQVLGLDIQYYAHLNYTAVRQAVDAVGGVDITIETDDPRGILDRNFDWKCNYKCYYVNYKKGEVAHMDGEHALAFSRARNAPQRYAVYGLPNGNFDREKNQQKVIKALREKAVSVGTLTDLGKVTGLIDALGNNLRTNFATKEIRTLMSLGSDIKSENIQSVSLVEEGNMLVTTGNINGASIVKPLAGLYDYSGIQAYVKKTVNANEITREGAKIVVLNGSGVSGVAQKEADKLTEQGFTIDSVANAPQGSYGDFEIYQIGDGMPATKAKLESLFGVTTKTTAPPAGAGPGTNFVVIVGKDRSASQ